MLIAALLGGIPPANAQSSKVVYDYPIKPGTEEWKGFTSTQEMIEVCQIPESILKNMSTSDLLDVCLKCRLK